MQTSPLKRVVDHLTRKVGTGPLIDLTDSELLERFCELREEAAFALLVERHGPAVFGVCRSILNDTEAAEDAFQMTFLVLLRKAGSVRKRESVRSFLQGVAYRIALRARVKMGERRARERQAVAPPSLPGTLEELSRAEACAVLHEEMGRLTDKYRRPLVLCYLEGRTHEQAAGELGWPRTSVSSRLKRGCELLRQRMSQRGVTLSAGAVAVLLAERTACAVPGLLIGTTVRLAAEKLVSGFNLKGATVGLAYGVLNSVTVARRGSLLALLLLIGLAVAGVGVLPSQTQPPRSDRLPPGEQDPQQPIGPARKGEERVDRVGDSLPARALARLGTQRFRNSNGDNPAGVAFLPDGRTVVTASCGGGIQFWEIATGRLVRTIGTDESQIWCLALSKDGKRLAVGEGIASRGAPVTRGNVRILDIATGKVVALLPRDNREALAHALEFTPDGKFVISLDLSGLVRVEEVATGKELLQQKFAREMNPCLALSPDGLTVALATGPNIHPSSLYLWEWQAGNEPRKIKAPPYAGRAMAFSPDGKLLAERGDLGTTIRVWNLATRKIVQHLDPPGTEPTWPSFLAFTADSKTLVATAHTNGGIGSIHLWDPLKGIMKKRIETNGRSAAMLAISADSSLLATTMESGISIWDVANAREVTANAEAHHGAVSHIVMAGNGLVVTASDDATIRAWDSVTAVQKFQVNHDGWVRSIALSPDGSHLVSSSLDDTVRLWDTATGREIYRLPGHGKVGGHRLVCFTPDGQRFLSYGDDHYLRVWDVRTGKALRESRIRSTGMEVPDEEALGRGDSGMSTGVFSGDGKTLVLAAESKVYVVDVETGKEVRQLDTELSMLDRVALSPDGRYLLVSSWGKPVERKLPDGRTGMDVAKDHPLELWDLKAGSRVRQTMLPGSFSGPLTFAADGRTYAAAFKEKEEKQSMSVRIWNTDKGEQCPGISVIPAPVVSLCFSPDGKRLVTGLKDTTALIWELKTLAPGKP
jgi:RNA polymerase sigma factor (sigma-70 family)